ITQAGHRSSSTSSPTPSISIRPRWRPPSRPARVPSYPFTCTARWPTWSVCWRSRGVMRSRSSRMRPRRTARAARLTGGGGRVARPRPPAAWSARRREHAAYYTRGRADPPAVRPPAVDPANEHIFHQYTVRVERRDQLQAHLKSQGIGNAVYYPVPLHLQPCFSHLGYRPGRLPESERASAEVLSLPVYPELTRGQLDCVIETIRGFYR